MDDESSAFFALAPHLLCIIGFDGHFKRLNPAWEKTLGFKIEELLSKPCLEIVHKEDREWTRARWNELSLGMATVTFENRCLTKDGSYRWLAWSAAAVAERCLIYAIARDITGQKETVPTFSPGRNAPGRMAGASGMAHDLSQRKPAAVQLRDERFSNALLESVQVGIVACDESGVLTVFNQVARNWHGLPPEPLPAEQWAEHYGWRHPNGNTPLRMQETPLYRALEGEWVNDVEMMIVPRQGEARTVLVTGRPIVDSEGHKLGAVAAMIDITERKCLEQQFRHSQKMEAVGRLAGGVAHDFNNLLTIITGYGRMLQRKLQPGSSERAHVDEIMTSGERGAALTRQLLAFSRRQDSSPRLLDLNAVVVNTQKMLQSLMGDDIEISTALTTDLGLCKADRGQMEQVIMNLAVNARDAMPRGGSLTLETANVDLDEAYVRGHIPVKPGPYVMLAISDTGCGMDTSTQAHIFEPFFTTKEPGKGTGLGLATVYGIIKQHGGNIWTYSEVGHGTSFKVYLPRVPGDTAQAEDRPPDPRTLRGSETVLVVEDEPSVRALMVRLLRSLGYWVLEASRADEALMVSVRHKGTINLLLTDVIMPQMSGGELLDRLRPLRPDLRVLFTSGYTEETLRRQGVEGVSAFLQKPFTEEALAGKVREVLDGRRDTASPSPSTR